MRNFSFSANYDFKSQFTTGYDYLTPAVPDGYESLEELKRKDKIDLWKDARKVKSGFLAPAYTNLALGIDLKPWKWLSLNFAPLTGGVVIVRNEDLRKNYGMELKKAYKDEAEMSPEVLEQFQEDMASGDLSLIGQYYKSMTERSLFFLRTMDMNLQHGTLKNHAGTTN